MTEVILQEVLGHLLLTGWQHWIFNPFLLEEVRSQCPFVERQVRSAGQPARYGSGHLDGSDLHAEAFSDKGDKWHSPSCPEKLNGLHWWLDLEIMGKGPHKAMKSTL